MNVAKYLARIGRGVGRSILRLITYALFYGTSSGLLYMYFLAAVTMVRLVWAATRTFFLVIISPWDASSAAVPRRALSHSHLTWAGW